MKNLFILLGIITSMLVGGSAYSQCTPGNEITCPDPENNGQICPEELPDAYTGQLYHEEFTILAPTVYQDTNSGLTVNIHHIKLAGIGNLPPGITWVTNVPDSILYPEVYNCVLLEGTTNQKGHYPVKLNIEVTISFGGNPVFFGTIIDSTSLAIDVVDQIGISENSFNKFNILEAGPNPFTNNFSLIFISPGPGDIEFRLYSVLGKLIEVSTFPAVAGENHFSFQGSFLKQGLYIFTIGDSRNSFTGRMIKSD